MALHVLCLYVWFDVSESTCQTRTVSRLIFLTPFTCASTCLHLRPIPKYDGPIPQFYTSLASMRLLIFPGL